MNHAQLGALAFLLQGDLENRRLVALRPLRCLPFLNDLLALNELDILARDVLVPCCESSSNFGTALGFGPRELRVFLG